MLFHPDDFNRLHYDFSIEKHRLTNDELLAYGQIATQVRKRFELDHDLLNDIADDPESARAMAEVVRSVKLHRRITKAER